MNYWDSKELVGISFNGNVFEISDQILANYLFYTLIFEEKVVELTKVFDILFPGYRPQIVEMFQSIIPIYGFNNSEIEREVRKVWDGICEDNQRAIPFVESFGQLLPIESLTYIDVLAVIVGF